MANTDQLKKTSSLAKVLRKVLKVAAWIFASLIFLLILLYILIQIPAVQDFARGKIVSYLQGKLKTKVEIAKLSIAFPKRIVLQGVYFEDQKKDTLLAGRELRVDISLLKLLSKQVDVQYIELNDIKTHIYRVQPDTVFNFDYIVKAFVTEQTKSSKPSDTTSALKFNVGRIVLNNITTTFKDDVTGSDMYFYLGSFDAKIKTFDPFKLIFDLPLITVKNIDARVHQYKPLITLLAVVDTSAAKIHLPSLNLNTLNFQNIKFNFRNDVSATYADLKIGEFATHFEKLNLQSSDIRLNDVVLNNTST
ncbi:MAG: AsmA family protein, partial [Parafilimonas sp.]